MDRRQFLGAGALALAVTGAGRPAWAQATVGAGDARLAALMDRVLWGDLRLDPTDYTYLGLDTGANAWARSRLGDVSQAGRIAAWNHAETMLAQLNRIDAAALPETDRTHAEMLRFTLNQRLLGKPFGLTYPGDPYVITQQDGIAGNIPDFLDSIHPVETVADAEAYLDRLNAFAYALDDETALQKSEAARGYAAPAWALQAAAAMRAGMVGIAAADSPMVRSLATRATAKGLPGDWQARAARILAQQVYPALSRQTALLESLVPRTRPGDGVWRVPEGEAIYAEALRFYTTVDLGADEIHRIGQEQVAEITAELDTMLAGAGLTQGTVGDRLQQLNARPDQLFDDSAQGRADLLRFLEERVARTWEKLGAAFDVLPDTRVEVRRVPEEIEVGASLGYYQSPPPDGSRPGAFYINLHDVKDWPRYSLPALIYHEALPGHHLQSALAIADESMPLVLRNQYVGSYSEGWALYSEMVADELGLYEGLEKAGALQSWLYRAARLVTDTGLHDKRWSREKGIDYFGTTVGYPANQSRSEVERYIANPGQACSYKIGQNVWVAQRKKAEAALGDGFSLPQFHRILLAGEMSLGMLERQVDAWIVAEKARLAS